MRRIIALGVGLFASFAAFADDLLQCLDSDLVQALISPIETNRATVFSTDVPVELAALEAPAGFAWIGSMQSEVRDVLAYETDLDVGDAETAALRTLAAAGWEEHEWLPRNESPFVLPSGPEAPSLAEICRGEETGALEVRDTGDARYVNIVYFGPGALCASRPRSSPGRVRTREMANNLPKLELPRGTRVPHGRTVLSDEGGSTSRDLVRFTQVESDLSAGELAAHLAGQMSAYGWTPDAVWSGELHAGSTWTKARDGATHWAGTIEVLPAGDRVYELLLRIQLLERPFNQ